MIRRALLAVIGFYSRAISPALDRKSTRLNSSHTVIYTLSLHDALPISRPASTACSVAGSRGHDQTRAPGSHRLLLPGHQPRARSEEHTSELQSHSDLHSFPTRRSSDLASGLDRLLGSRVPRS